MDSKIYGSNMLKLNESQVFLGNKCPTRGKGLKCRHSPAVSKTSSGSSSSLIGIKLHYYTILIVVLAYQITNSHPCQSALLTNIYGGKKLSEIKGDISHRFLLIPSPAAASRNIDYQSQLAANLHAYEQEQQQKQSEQQYHDPYSYLGLAQQPHVSNNNPITQLLTPDETSPSSAGHASSSSGGDEPLPSPSPLVTQWRQQQQGQSQNNQKSARLAAGQQQNGSNSYQPELITLRSVPLGEPVVLENMSTEFPNPNINNLGHEITKILRKFFLHGYDKRVRPNYSGPPALVNVSFHIIGISSVDEVQMDFTTDFYFRQKWFDPRLEFDPVGEIDELCVGAEFAEKIWLPDTFFANEKTATFHKATTENTFIRIGQNGRVYRSIRLTVTCSCPMDLQYFPMDRQRCKIEIESYGYNTRDIDYRWERGDASVSLNTKIELPQFKILGFKMGQEIQNLSSGDYIRLYCEIHFVRSMGYYLFQIYIPASLIVMISWVSFWLHRNATPARVALGVTTVLTMTTLMSSTNAALPKISYIKSIDVFLGTCFVMVFAALLEYASVGYIGKRIAMKRKRLQDLQQMQQHHQKVCVAAAASAAAAAVAAQQQQYQQDQASSIGNLKGSNQSPSGRSQTIHRRSIGSNLMKIMQEGSKTLQRSGRSSSKDQSYQGIDNGEPNLFGHRPSFKSQQSPLDSGGNTRLNPISPRVSADQANGRTPLLAAGAAIAAAAAANQHTHGPTTEFEVNQTHDMIRICGLTPSAIDKHSRVVFPICFVCFNLMYWIIYGHISQQIEDKGPPLIPFIKN